MVTPPRRKLPIASTALVALAVGAYLLWMLPGKRGESSAQRASPDARAPASPSTAEVSERRSRRPVVSPEPAAVRAPAAMPARLAAPVASQAFADKGPSAPDVQCTRDSDCAGPRQAECIRPSCLEGYCVYDDSHCECASSSDCEDNDPCTRNHCFVPTMKCIFIPEGCD